MTADRPRDRLTDWGADRAPRASSPLPAAFAARPGARAAPRSRSSALVARPDRPPRRRAAAARPPPGVPAQSPREAIPGALPPSVPPDPPAAARSARPGPRPAPVFAGRAPLKMR